MTEMSMSELVERSGVARATVKFYLRDGLLHPGRRATRTWSVYDESHLERLRLIGVLSKVGNLPLETSRALLAAIDSPDVSEVELMKRCQTLLVNAWRADGTASWATDDEEIPNADGAWSDGDVADLLIDSGYEHALKMEPIVSWLQELLKAFDSVSPLPSSDFLSVWMPMARSCGEQDVAVLRGGGLDRRAIVQTIIVATVLGGQIVNVLRMLAHAESVISARAAAASRQA